MLEQLFQQHLVELEGGWARNHHVGDDALNLSQSRYLFRSWSDQTAVLQEQPFQQHLVELKDEWARNHYVGDDALDLSSSRYLSRSWSDHTAAFLEQPFQQHPVELEDVSLKKTSIIAFLTEEVFLFIVNRQYMLL